MTLAHTAITSLDGHLLVAPVVVGGGEPGLTRTVRVDLELLDERRFENGFVHPPHRTR